MSQCDTMTAQSPDLNCALYLWRLQVYNDYNVDTMNALLKLLKHTKSPSDRYVPSSLMEGEQNAAAATDVKFTDMYPPYEGLDLMQGLMAMAIVATDLTLFLWIVKNVAFFWKAVVDVSFSPLGGLYTVYKWSYFVDYRKDGNESLRDADHRKEELLERLEAIRKRIPDSINPTLESGRQLPRSNAEDKAPSGLNRNQETLDISGASKIRDR
ncbi:conserved hypothetical protein [Echinococcus multilocularis]|uniref:Uncharacterized protein n=1 Tax=Echinococcus multilocularis TaxID=6211 RepID=A0A068Y4C6_ECHMU|nr:conserved hypothetical protein [Echinococcus multilocularis]